MAGGRPTKYKKEYCEELVKHMSMGLSFESFAAVVNTTRTVIYVWADKYPEFRDAKEKGRGSSLNFHEKLLMAIASGKLKGNVAAAIFSMTNKHGDLYKNGSQSTQFGVSADKGFKIIIEDYKEPCENQETKDSLKK